MGVLDGIHVLEVAEQGFVPSAAAILADWGADVVKVERPTGDPLRHYAKLGVVPDVEGFNILFEQFNRNKRSVAIDLRNDEGRAALDGLIAWADVFVTSFLPSAREKLRLRTDDIWAVNPRCIYAIGSGQGSRGPTPTRAGSTRCRSGHAAGWATSSPRRARPSSCRAARSVTRRAVRTSRAASVAALVQARAHGRGVGRRRVAARRRGLDARRRPRRDCGERRRGQAALARSSAQRHRAHRDLSHRPTNAG